MRLASWFRTVLGFVIAPIAPGMLVVVLTMLRAGSDALSARGFSGSAWIIGLSAVLGYPIAIVLGLPLHVFFRWRGWNALPIYLLSGAFLGLVVYSVYFASVLLNDDSASGLRALAQQLSHTAPQLIPAGMLSGAVAAASFWLIARPDRTSNPD
jgi:hypothetical protein